MFHLAAILFNKIYNLNSIVNIEVMSKLFDMFENINKSNLKQKKKNPKKMLIEPCSDRKVNHFPLLHRKELDPFITMPIKEAMEVNSFLLVATYTLLS